MEVEGDEEEWEGRMQEISVQTIDLQPAVQGRLQVLSARA
jgi:hypothetical protein